MTTKSVHKVIIPEQEEDESKRIWGTSAIDMMHELMGTAFNEELLVKQEIRFLCYYADNFEILDIRLPSTYHKFYEEIFDRLHWSWRYRWLEDPSDRKFLMQYYDETVYNCIDLNDENWLEFRKKIVISAWRRPYFGSRSHEVRLIITAVDKWNIRFSRKLIDNRLAQHESYDMKGQKTLGVLSDEPPTSLTPAIGWNPSKEILSRLCPMCRMNINDTFKTGDIYSLSEEDDVEKTTVLVKDTVTRRNPYSQPEKRITKLNLAATEYSFIYLLSEADASASDELIHVSDEPQIFLKPYECLSEIVKAVSQKLIIIVSQSLLKHFIPLIHDLIQVIYIYILHKYDTYDENEEDNYINDKRYPKIRGSFVEQTMLISKLDDDLDQISDMPFKQLFLINSFEMKINIDFYVISKQLSSLKLVTVEETDFMSFQLIIKTILESGSANPLNNLSTSLELCQLFPNKNEEKLLWETDDKFPEKYVSEKAIHFYLNDTSLKNEVNTCFQDKNIQKICKLWFYIRDLLKQLPDSKKSTTVYRGQCLTTDQLQILKTNIGGFITFNKFFSMSTSNIRAILCSEEGNFDTELKSVVFHLEINNGSTTARFSMIQQSYEEQIFLFAAGSIFRIESVEQLNDKIWCCKLSVNSDDKFELTRMFQYYETEIGTSLTYLSLGVYLNEIGEVDLARQYYETLLAVSIDNDIIFSIYNNLAIIFERTKDLTSAQKYWDLASKLEKVNTTKMSTPLPEQKSIIVNMADPISDTSPILNYYNLACVYQQAKYFSEALEACEKALKISTTASDPTHIALVHSVMGSIYYSQQNYEGALNSFQMALDIALIHLKATDPLIDQYLNNVRLSKDRINEKES